MYVKVKDGAVDVFPYGGGELKRDNPNISFPATMEYFPSSHAKSRSPSTRSTRTPQ